MYGDEFQFVVEQADQPLDGITFDRLMQDGPGDMVYGLAFIFLTIGISWLLCTFLGAKGRRQRLHDKGFESMTYLYIVTTVVVAGSVGSILGGISLQEDLYQGSMDIGMAIGVTAAAVLSLGSLVWVL